MTCDPGAVAVKIHGILHVDEIDKDALIKIIGEYGFENRMKIVVAYDEHIGSLQEDLKAKLTGNFLNTVMFMTYDKAGRDARFLNEAMVGLGTDEACLDEILTTQRNDEMKHLKMKYKNIFGTELEQDVIGDTSFDYKNFLVLLLKGSRKDEVSPEKAKKTAKALFDAGEGKLGTDEKVFINTFSTNSFVQLGHVFEEYEKIEGASKMCDAIQSEFSSDIRNSLMTAYRYIVDSTDLYVGQIHAALFKPNIKALIRYVTTLEEELPEIKKQYVKKYETSLVDDLKKITGGSFGKLLVAVVERHPVKKDTAKVPVPKEKKKPKDVDDPPAPEVPN